VKVLEVRDLRLWYGTARGAVRAVDGVSLEIDAGEVLGLVGESGCGKSTLGRCIVGLYRPTGGEIRYAGETLLAKRQRSQRRRMQMVFQDPYSSLNPRMTVRQVLSELLLEHAHGHAHICAVERLAHSRELLRDVHAGRSIFDHPLDPAQLALRATQAPQDVGPG